MCRSWIMENSTTFFETGEDDNFWRYLVLQAASLSMDRNTPHVGEGLGK